MASNINTVLAECESNAKQLVEEIDKYKAAGILSNDVAQSLIELSRALKDTHSRIRPFTSVLVNKILIAMGTLLIINIGLLITILLIILKKQN